MPIVNCNHCSKEFSRTPARIKKHKNHFCSEECRCIWRKKEGKKKGKGCIGICKECGQEYIKEREARKFCSLKCSSKYNFRLTFPNHISIADKQLSDVIKLKDNKFLKIRDHAKRLYLKKDSTCQNCNFSYHVDVCHIKAISSFSKDTLVAEINAKTNILLLCKNCHFELDSGILRLEKKKEVKKDEIIRNGRFEDRIQYQNTKNDNKMLKELIRLNGNPSHRYENIRGDARRRIKNLKQLCCQNCKYSKRTNVCHLRPISNFSPNTRLSIINDVKNLLVLCPNCHWCLDHGYLKFENNIFEFHKESFG